MKQHDRFNFNLSFLDMVFNMLMVFVMLFILSFIQIREEESQNKKQVEMKAEAIIVLTWDDESIDDIDLWVQLPDKRMVSFKNKEVDFVVLDRDDRGIMGETYHVDGKTYMVKNNKEVVSLRAIVPGHYVVNIHVFDMPKVIDGFAGKKAPYTAKVQLTKINPQVIDVATKELTITEINEQFTAFSFDVREDGTITNIDLVTKVPFVPVLGAARTSMP